MPIEVKNRYTGAVIRTVDAETLSGANLSGVDLSGVDLSRANLSGVDLSGANLSGVDLSRANLSGVDLSRATLPTAETWEVYCAEVVPALLAAGGNPVAPEAWQCHNWDNCLIACAFGVHRIQDVPALYRPRAEQLIQFFDARLLDHLAPQIPACMVPAAHAEGGA